MDIEIKPILCSYYYDPDGNRYSNFAEKLKRDCERFNIEYEIIVPDGISDFYLSMPSYADKRHWLPRYKPTYLLDAIERHKRPIFYMDCDGKILKEPNWSEMNGCDIGYDIGVEAKERNDLLGGIPAATYYNYTEMALNFLKVWKYKCDNIMSNAADHFFFSYIKRVFS